MRNFHAESRLKATGDVSGQGYLQSFCGKRSKGLCGKKKREREKEENKEIITGEILFKMFAVNQKCSRCIRIKFLFLKRIVMSNPQ